jgi:putative membrane protein
MNDWQAGRVIETHQADKVDKEQDDSLSDRQQSKIINQAIEQLSDNDNLIEDELNNLHKPRKRNWITRFFWLTLTLLIIVELVLSVAAAFETSPLLAVIYTVFYSCLLGMIGRITFREFRLLMKLKSTHTQQLTADRLMHSVQFGEAKPFLTKLNQSVSNDTFDQFLAAIEDHHTDREVMALYSKTVLVEQDNQAQHIIQNYASTSGVMVAISPIALIDMAIVLWRSTAMIEEITRLYGLPLGYVSRVRLYRMVLKQIVFAGTTELMADFATTALGAELTGKLSMRAAQGISVSIFSARIGYKAMELSRPIAGLPNKKNVLSSCIKSALDRITTSSKTANSGK